MENESMEIPSSILLLHGLGGSGQGSVALLEQQLRKLGWNDAKYVRPTLSSVQQPIQPFDGERTLGLAWKELNAILDGRIPNLVVGFSFGGLLAAFSDAPLRLSVCSPWSRLPADALHRVTSRHGLAVIQGLKDTVVPADENLVVLPPHIPIERDDEGSHDFDAWMERIGSWVQQSWARHPFKLAAPNSPTSDT
jgi:hypothetical protein